MLVIIATDAQSRRVAGSLGNRFPLLTVTDTPVEAMAGETVLPMIKKGRGVRLRQAFAYAFGQMGADRVITLPRGGCEASFVLRVAEALENGALFVDGGLHTASPFRMGGAVRLLTTFTTGSHRVPWCGLRGYDRSLAPLLAKVGGRHDEYEITLLQAAVADGIKIVDLPCDKAEDGGAAAPRVRMSIGLRAIWGIFCYASSLKFMCSSAFAFLVDFTLLMVLAYVIPLDSAHLRESTAQVISWIVSSQLNFYVNHFLVFRKKGGLLKAMSQYYSLAVIILFGKVGVLLLLEALPLGIAKIICEGSFFLINYFVQKKLIFNRKKKVKNHNRAPE